LKKEIKQFEKNSYDSLEEEYKIKSKRLDKILIQSDKQQYKLMKLNDELEDYKKNLELKVEEEIKKRIEKEKMLFNQSRLAQMGEMISMIAHQWRQPLAAISATCGAISIKAQLNKLDDTTAIELTNKISEYSQHLSSTIDDFREFFKTNKEKKDISFSELINSVLRIIEISLSNKDIKLKQDLKCDDKFSSYPNELKQVILNLIKNSEDILKENEVSNPFIKIKTYKEDKKFILEVIDNGGGISDDIINNIFDPYFSTKTKKDGTGLGLYMSKLIVEEHCKGKLTVSNIEIKNKNGESTCGALFKISLGEKVDD